jgi:cytochrome c556
VAWLKQAGTSVEYEGLYRSAAEFRPPAASALNAVRDLPEIAKTSTLVETMVAIDGEFDQLKEARSAGWPANSGQSRRSPSEAATILWEHFKELIRVQEIAARPSDFRARLDAAANAAEVLKSLLRDSSSGAAARDGAFKTLGETCGSCHKKFRN